MCTCLFFRCDIDWDDYCEQAHRVCNDHLRAQLQDLPRPVLCPKISVSFERPLPASKILWTLMKVLKVKRRVQKNDITAAKFVMKDLSALYALFRTQLGSLQIRRDILLKAGVPVADVNTMEATFSMLEPNRITAQFKQMLKRLSVGGTAVLKLYVHMLYQMATFAVIPVRSIRTPPEFGSNTLPYLLVCTSCFTIRSQVHGVNVHRKSKDGIHVDTINFSVTCTKCESPGIEMVDLR